MISKSRFKQLAGLKETFQPGQRWASNFDYDGMIDYMKNIDVQRSSSPKNLFAVDDLVFFEANKNELWLSDGTGVGTRFVQDFGNDVISRNLGGEEGSGSTQSGKLAMANLDGSIVQGL